MKPDNLCRVNTPFHRVAKRPTANAECVDYCAHDGCCYAPTSQYHNKTCPHKGYSGSRTHLTPTQPSEPEPWLCDGCKPLHGKRRYMMCYTWCEKCKKATACYQYESQPSDMVIVRRDYAEQILSALEVGTIEHIRLKAALAQGQEIPEPEEKT